MPVSKTGALPLGDTPTKNLLLPDEVIYKLITAALMAILQPGYTPSVQRFG
jgi:hypothetical protein